MDNPKSHWAADMDALNAAFDEIPEKTKMQPAMKFCKDCRYGGPRVAAPAPSEDAWCEHPSGTDQRVSLVTGEVVEKRQLTCEQNRKGLNGFGWKEVCRFDGGDYCSHEAKFFEPLP